MSPLAGDINWMETIADFGYVSVLPSPLAGDINWMETAVISIYVVLIGQSPLAGDINWMETRQGSF